MISQHEKYMTIALEEARKAYNIGEIPVGAVLVVNDAIIAQSHNMTEILQDPSEHAELRVIRKAAALLNTRRLLDSTLYVTLEPCAMCAGAIVLSRIPKVVYATSDPKTGAVNSLYSLLNDSRLNHQCDVIADICKDESTLLLQQFFRDLRSGLIVKSSSSKNTTNND